VALCYSIGVFSKALNALEFFVHVLFVYSQKITKSSATQRYGIGDEVISSPPLLCAMAPGDGTP
jgi:hypothetical protein